MSPSLLLLLGAARADTLHAVLRVDGDRPELVHATLTPDNTVAPPPGALEVLGDGNVVLATAALPPRPRLRSVLTPDGHDTAVDPARYVRVHLPWPAGSRALRLGPHVVSVADHPRLRRAAAPPSAEPVRVSGSPGKRLDLVFLAEGYTADRAGAFATHVEAVVDHLLSIDPWGAYADLIDVWRVFVPARDGGIDALEGVDEVASPFECHYGCGLGGTATSRLICCDQARIAAVVDAAAPFADGVMLLVDDTTYGGSGGVDYAVAYTGDAAALQVAVHELGHTLVHLWDEYPYGFDEHEAETLLDPDPSDGIDDVPYVSPNCAPMDAPVPWEAWLEDGPIEWPLWHAVRALVEALPLRHGHLACDGRTLPGPDAVCAFPACSFDDWVRPTHDTCLMHALGDRYCPVCREAIVRRLYAAAGRTLVRAADPPIGRRVRLDADERRAFRVDAVGSDLRWTWSSGGRVLHEGPDFALDGSQKVCGDLTLTLRDDTPWVRHDPDGLLEDRVHWRVSTDPCCGCASTDTAAIFPLLPALAVLLRRRRP